MQDYITLIAQREILTHRIRVEEQRLHDNLVEKRKKIFNILDIMVAVIVLMNFGAVFTTNLLVVQEAHEQNATMEYLEVNPVQADVNEYKAPSPEELSPMLKAMAFNAMLWVIILFIYVYERRNIRTDKQLTILITFVAMYFMAIGLDFFNDLGFFIAEVILK